MLKCFGNRRLPRLNSLNLSFEDVDPLKNLTTDASARAIAMPNIRRLQIYKPLGINCRTVKRFSMLAHIFPNIEHLTLRYCPLYCKKGHLDDRCPRCDAELKKVMFERFDRIRHFTIHSERSHPTDLQLVNNDVCHFAVESHLNPRFILPSMRQPPTGGQGQSSLALTTTRAKSGQAPQVIPPTTSTRGTLMTVSNNTSAVTSTTSTSSTKQATNHVFSVNAIMTGNHSEPSTVKIETPSSTCSSPPNVIDFASSPILAPGEVASIWHMPNNVLVNIFSNFSLQAKLVIISSVCKRWRSVVDRQCRQLLRLHVFPNMERLAHFYTMYHSLACFNTFHGLAVRRSEIVVGPRRVGGSSNRDFIRFLHRKFPKIEECVVYCPIEWTEEDAVTLLGSVWRYRLRLFGLFMDPYGGKEAGNGACNFRWNLVYPAICLARELKHLILCDIGSEIPEGLEMVLEKLETLYLGYHGRNLFEVVNRLGANLRRLALFHHKLDSDEVDLQVISDVVSKNLEHLSLESGLFEKVNHPFCGMMLNFIGNYFQGLKVLDVPVGLGVSCCIRDIKFMNFYIYHSFPFLAAPI